MSKILTCAIREYKATVLTKWFIVGVIIAPVLMVLAFALAAGSEFLAGEKPPTTGTVLVLDSSENQVVLGGLREWFSEEAQRERLREREELVEEALEQAPAVTPGAERMARSMMPKNLKFDVEVVGLDPEATDLEAQKRRVLEDEQVVMLVVVGQDAIDDPEDGSFSLFHPKEIDADRVGDVRRGISDIVVEARMRKFGYEAEQIAEIDRLRSAPEANVTTVTPGGEQETSEVVQRMIPFAFFFLIWLSVLSGGQYLLMSTMEEKSSRVMEVLLSGISPTQLMVGKILGGGLVGLTILALYGGAGIVSVIQFGLMDLVPLHLFAYLAMYFLMGYFMFAAMYAAIGAAVTDIREANTLLTPLMILIMLPFFAMIPLVENPGSTFARIISFVPPLTPFIMPLRLSQPSVEVPVWEILGTTVAGVAGVAFLVWASAKIFRIGVLMYGQPPTLMGLIKWIRYA